MIGGISIAEVATQLHPKHWGRDGMTNFAYSHSDHSLDGMQYRINTFDRCSTGGRFASDRKEGLQDLVFALYLSGPMRTMKILTRRIGTAYLCLPFTDCLPCHPRFVSDIAQDTA